MTTYRRKPRALSAAIAKVIDCPVHGNDYEHGGTTTWWTALTRRCTCSDVKAVRRMLGR